MSDTTIYVLELLPEAAEREFKILSTRQTGKKFGERFHARLSDFGSDVAIKISFHGVHLMDASFADEVFGAIGVSRSDRTSGYIPPFYIADLDSTSLDNLNMALDSRTRRHKALRNCIIPVYKEGRLELVGKSEDHVEQTFELLGLTKQLTTPNLATVLRLSDAAASTRLKVLYDLGLALRTEIRDEQGRQFVYRSLT